MVIVYYTVSPNKSQTQIVHHKCLTHPGQSQFLNNLMYIYLSVEVDFFLVVTNG